jgi:zinc protease
LDIKVKNTFHRFIACTGLYVLLTAAAPIESFTLPNGLEVIVIENHRVPAVSQMLWYRIGGADDPSGKSGLAHFHEHMMFLGTPQYKAGEYSSIVAKNGGQENAFTGADATSYYITIAKEKLPLAMELEADRMRGITPSDADAVKEKQVIIEERRMRIENNPHALLGEQMNAALFRNHPYHWPIIGWMSEMEGLTKDDVLAFHKKWYHPNNAILILSGDITMAQAKPLVQKYYGNLKKAEIPQRKWNPEPPQNTQRRVTLHHTNVKQPSFHRNYASDSLVYGQKERALPLFVLTQMLGGGKSSRLYQTLVVEQKLATDIDVNYNGFTLGPAVFSIDITPEQGISLNTLEQALDKELTRAMSEGFTEKELSRAKTQLKAETIYARDGITAMARIMGWIRIAGLNTDYFNRWPEMIDAVTPTHIQDAAKATLLLNQSVTGLLLPQEKK